MILFLVVGMISGFVLMIGSLFFELSCRWVGLCIFIRWRSRGGSSILVWWRWRLFCRLFRGLSGLMFWSSRELGGWWSGWRL